MNRKITLLLVSFVALVLPTVAVADMMVSGTADFTGSSHDPIFTVTTGSNYAQADGYVVWKAYTGSSYMGDLRLNNAPNEIITAINVMQINFEPGLASGTFYLNLTGKSPNLFIAGSLLYLSTSPLSFANFSSPYSPSSPAPGIIHMSLAVPNGNTISSGPITVGGGINTIYIGVYLTAGQVNASPSVPELEVAGTYVSG